MYRAEILGEKKTSGENRKQKKKNTKIFYYKHHQMDNKIK